MDVTKLEQYLAQKQYRFKTVTGGVAINLGFLIGRVHVGWDAAQQQFNFNDKARWFSHVLVIGLLGYFLVTNWHVYTDVQLKVCIAVTIAMAGSLSYKEWRIGKLKNELNQAFDINQSH
ncbi:hypothetical protein HGP28_12820 [Vibrio sp. SM6]|uniref:Uncharacterized protein n=1 Tax=Vibrio agarilyticus TaxID=2726741 RepID=A0A7X8TS56_9VIBR|nr:hypothetical protein [Vibrio agarilyticus]NLS13774.1 hypothetical protein [Vibrio agarilyticus]